MHIHPEHIDRITGQLADHRQQCPGHMNAVNAIDFGLVSCFSGNACFRLIHIFRSGRRGRFFPDGCRWGRDRSGRRLTRFSRSRRSNPHQGGPATAQDGFRKMAGAFHHFLEGPAGLLLGIQKLLMGFNGLRLQGLQGL